MASAFTHIYVASASCLVFQQTHSELRKGKFWALAGACSVLPDADAVFHALREPLGIPWGHPLGHRGVTHTLLFAALLGISAAAAFYGDLERGSVKWWGIAAFFTFVTATHPLLDAITGGGLGLMFFYPLSSERYFLPWRPIRTSPIGIRSFFSERGIEVIRTETLYVWLPVLILVALYLYVRRRAGAVNR